MSKTLETGNFWISQNEILNLQNFAEEYPTTETGGILMGYSPDDSQDVVVTHIVGPGPNAIHSKSRFLPDNEFHKQIVRQIYKASDRKYYYLGDWHTHPRGSCFMSSYDKRTLQRISKYKQARILSPIMCILADYDEWEIGVWRLTTQKLFFCNYRKFLDLKIKTFDD